MGGHGSLQMKRGDTHEVLANFVANEDAEILGWFLNGLEVGTKASLYGDRNWRSHPSLWMAYDGTEFVIWIASTSEHPETPLLFFGDEDSGSPIATFTSTTAANHFSAFLDSAFRTQPVTEGPRAFAYWDLRDFDEAELGEALILVGDAANNHFALGLTSENASERLAVIKNRNDADRLAAAIDGLIGAKSVGRLGGAGVQSESMDGHAGVEWISADVDAEGRIERVTDRLWVVTTVDHDANALLVPDGNSESVVAQFDSVASADSFVLFIDRLLAAVSASGC